MSQIILKKKYILRKLERGLLVPCVYKDLSTTEFEDFETETEALVHCQTFFLFGAIILPIVK